MGGDGRGKDAVIDAPALRETIRVVSGALPLLPFHLERLSEGGIPAEALVAIGPALEAAAREDPAAFKLQAVVGPDGAFDIHPSAEGSSLDVARGPVIEPVVVRALPTLPRCAAKPADRAYWDGAQHLAELRRAHQAILVTAEGDVIDGGTASVWAVIGGTLVTPPAPPAIAGVARRVILRELAPALGLRADVRPLALEELLSADEVLLSNAIGGVVAARGRGGPLGERLRSAWRERLELPSAEQ